MYQVEVTVKGTSVLLQHRFPMPDLATASKGAKRKSGAVDYSTEWRQALYVNADGQIYQPGLHFEASLVAAAAQFKITGARGKSYRDLLRSSVFVRPDEILHGLTAPESLTADADEKLYIDARPVVIQRSRIVRLRPAFKAGWQLSFTIECIDDQIHEDLLLDVLTLAGRTIGIGDHRPKFGRFAVVHFKKLE